MYFDGLNQTAAESDWESYDLPQSTYFPDIALPGPSSVSAPAIPTANAGSGFSINWGDTLSKALVTWGQVKSADTQLEIAKAQAARGLVYNPLSVPGKTSVAYPFTAGAGTGTVFGLPVQWIIIGAAVIGAAILLSDKKRR